MHTLNDLKELIDSLEKKELKKVTEHIADKKINTFFTTIQYRSKEEMQIFDRNEKKLNNTIQILYHLIIEISTPRNNITQIGNYSSIGRAKLLIKKQLIFAQYLLSKNLINKAIDYYEDNAIIAIKYEFYDYLLITLYDLDNLYSVLCQYEKFKENYRQIEYYEKIRAYSREAHHLFNKNGIERTIFSNNQSLVNEIELTLPKLNDFYIKSNSPQVKWYYYRLLIDYLEAKNNYTEALSTAIELLYFQKNKHSINTPLYLGITYKLITRFNIALYNFNDAMLSIEKAKKIDNRMKHNHELSLLTEFYIWFHSEKYLEAKRILTQVSNTTDFSMARKEYYNACINFFNKSGESHPDKTELTKEIEKDKEGWNIHIRIFLIIKQLDLNKNDLANSYIESLRKHIERNKTREVAPRLLLIVKMLRELIKEDFNYKNTWEKHSDPFKLLSSETNEDYSWKILSPELIRFDVWFEAKVRRLAYQEVFNERVKAIKTI